MTDYKKIMKKLEIIKYERRLDILMQRKIIWRQNPTTDIPTETHNWGWWFKEGTHQYYALFQYDAKIGTFWAFKWHLRVLWYLNPDLTGEEFTRLVNFMGESKNGFVLHTFSPKWLDAVIKSVFDSDLEKAPSNNLRRVVFREHHGLTLREQQQISGKYGNLGKGISPEDVYEEMLRLNDQRIRISIKNLAENLGVTTRTVHRNLDDTLREEKKELNKNLILTNSNNF